MNMIVRCALMAGAVFVLAGCEATTGPRRLAGSMHMTKSRATGPDGSWKKGLVNPFMKHDHEPSNAPWTRRARARSRMAALESMGGDGAPLITGSLGPAGSSLGRGARRGGSIRAMAMRLAPAGVNVATLSPMVRKSSHAQINCFPPRLRMILNTVAWHYGKKVRILSGYRSHRHNRRVGGARHSYHLSCQAADIQVSGVGKYELARFLKKLPGRGGVGTYCNVSSVHIDVGPKRSWHYGCGMKSLAMRRLARYRKSLGR